MSDKKPPQEQPSKEVPHLHHEQKGPEASKKSDQDHAGHGAHEAGKAHKDHAATALKKVEAIITTTPIWSRILKNDFGPL